MAAAAPYAAGEIVTLNGIEYVALPNAAQGLVPLSALPGYLASLGAPTASAAASYGTLTTADALAAFAVTGTEALALAGAIGAGLWILAVGAVGLGWAAVASLAGVLLKLFPNMPAGLHGFLQGIIDLGGTPSAAAVQATAAAYPQFAKGQEHNSPGDTRHGK